LTVSQDGKESIRAKRDRLSKLLEVENQSA
jgi:hypothetical protein